MPARVALALALAVLWSGCASEEADTETAATGASSSGGGPGSSGSTTVLDPSASVTSAAATVTSAASTSDASSSNASHGDPIYEDPESEEIIALCTTYCEQIEVDGAACACLDWCLELATTYFVGTFADYVQCQIEVTDAEVCGCAEDAVQCPTHRECSDEEHCGTESCWGG